VKYFMSAPPRSQPEWRVDRATLESQLAARWGDIEIVRLELGQDAPDLQWHLYRGSGHSLLGNVESDRRGVVLDGPEEGVAEFAEWFRSRVPAMVELALFDEFYTMSMELAEGVKSVDILGLIRQPELRLPASFWE
jgi:hypothetical protein